MLGGASVVSRPATLTDYYALLLVASLSGYAFFGKGYAYAGVPPLFITEGVLSLGLLLLLHTGCILSTFSAAPLLMYYALFILAIERTVPYVSVWGINALRDSVLVCYGLFSIITVALLLERPERVATTLRFLQWFSTVFVYVVPVLYALNAAGVLRRIPGWPASGEPLIAIRAGEVGVHVCGCTLMGLLGLRRVSGYWNAVLLLDIVLIAALSRGGMLAIVVPVAFVVVLSGRWRQLIGIGLLAGTVLALLYIVDFNVPLHQSNDRNLSVRQMVDNVVSITGSAGKGDLDDDKKWRLIWWKKIEAYTFAGPYFWSGKGFGVNLADADGFQGTDMSGPPLRSPHNSHLSILARMGVPGFALWIGVGLAWLVAMMDCILLAWRRGDQVWGDLMLLTVGYWMAIVVDASFDVALEAPMLGVWFWCLFGFGVGCKMIYETPISRLVGTRGRLLTSH